MSILYINTGSTANAGDGDSLRTAFTKINQNFQFIGGLTNGALEAGTGYTGSQGEYGYTGSGGFDGSRGFVGSRGAGYTGSASEIPGPIGYAGSRGFLGYAGSQGNLGPIGYVGSASTEVGYAGSQGDQGPIGYVGSQSTEIGYTGSQGEQGIGFVGSQGVTGYAGSRGDLGFTGSIGPEGPQGFSPDVVPGGIYIELDPDPVYTNQGAVYVSTLTQTFVDGQAVRLRANIFRDNTTPIAIGVIREDGGAGALLVFDENNILTMYQMAPGYQNAISQQYDLSNNIFGIRRYLTMEWQVTPDSVNGSVLFGGVLGIGAVEMEQVDPFFLNLGDITNGAWYLCAYSGGGRQDIADVAYELGIGIGGANGYTGSAGAGYTGSASTAIGYTGSSGTDGFTGSIGYSGSTGYVGSASTEAGPQGLQGFDGSSGYTGSRGAGFTGSAGVIGYTGSRGFVGSTGFIGSRGDTGFFGSFGYTGSVGPQGIQGDTGLDGLIGYTGSTGFGFTGSVGIGYTGSRSTLPGPLGYTGSAGTDGVIGRDGYTGSAGANGFTGSAGAGFTGSAGIGLAGDRGSSGYTGSAGAGFTGSAGAGYTGSAGANGTNGFTGSAGTNGSNGFTGSAGAGYTGSSGDNGFTGSAGTNGYVGSAGANGTNGFTGSSGFIGSSGFTGSSGSTGFTGSVGSAGYTGSTGSAGYIGSQGDKGDQGNQGLQGISVTLVSSTATSAGLPITGNPGDGWIVNDTGHLWFWNTLLSQWNDIGVIVGPQGYTGYSGSRGLSGFTGSVGVAGNNGYNGSQGNAGFTGSSGANGTNGFTGSVGADGTTGYTGSASAGYTGSRGIQGEPGGAANTANFAFTASQMSVSNDSDITLVTNANTWTFGADGNLTAPGHLLPNANLTYDLGSTTTQWRSIYVGTGTIYIGGVALGVNQDNYVTVDGNPIITVNTATGNLTVQGDVVIGSVTVSDTAPTANTGTQWFNTLDGRTYIAYSGQWIDASPTVVPLPETYLDEITIDGSTINMNGSTLYINTAGTLLVNGSPIDTFTETNVSYFTNDAGYLTASTVNTYVNSFTGTDQLVKGSYNITLGNTGVLTLSTASTIVGGGTGTDVTVIASTGSNTSTWVFGADGGLTFPQGVTLGDYPGVGPAANTIALSGAQVYLSSTNGSNWVGVENGAPSIGASESIVLSTNNAGSPFNWTFSSTGTLQVPSAGSITFPDATVQTTAFTGTIAYSNVTGAGVVIPAASNNVYSLGSDFTSTIVGGNGIGAGYIRVESFNQSFSQVPISTRLYNQLATLTTGSQFTVHAVVDGTTYNTVVALDYIFGGGAQTERNDLYFNRVSGDELPFSYSATELTLSFAGSAFSFTTSAVTFPDATVQTTAWTGTIVTSQISDYSPEGGATALTELTDVIISNEGNAFPGQVLMYDGATWINGDVLGGAARPIYQLTSSTAVVTLSADGGLTFPDATVQTTAFTGTIAYSNVTGAPAAFNTSTLVAQAVTAQSLTAGVTLTAVANAGTTSTTAAGLGYIGMPQNSTATSYTLVAGDQGKHVYVTATGQTITVPANTATSFPIGTSIAIIAGPSATTVSISITSDTMYLGGAGTTGTRTLAAYGMATLVKVAATTWFINGSGLT